LTVQIWAVFGKCQVSKLGRRAAKTIRSERHDPPSIALEVEHAIPAGDSVKDLSPNAHSKVSEAAQAPSAKKDFNFHKLLMAGAAVVVLAGAAWYGWDYWPVGQYLVSTDDAYVKADNTTIAPKVFGYLREVLVRDNERVKAGQVLARIDERDFQVVLDQARSDVAAAEAAIASKQAQLGVQQAVIDAAKGTIDVDKADFRRSGEQAQHRSRHHRVWQRAECPAGAIAHRRCTGRGRT
jgi:multidrug resistance efflux pump